MPQSLFSGYEERLVNHKGICIIMRTVFALLTRSNPVAQDDLDEEKETDETAEAALAAQAAQKKKKKTKLLMAVGGLIALLLIGGAGTFFALHGTPQPQAEGVESEDERSLAAPAVPIKSGAPVFYALGDILVNLSGDGKRPSFLKVRIALELNDAKDTATLDTLKPRIIDYFQGYLRELRVEDLRGSAGLYRLREELLARVNEAVAPLSVRDVLFQEILVQ